MADSAETETTETEGTEGTESTESTEEKSVPQSEVDRIVESRLARERKKFADYDQLKERAAKLDEIEQAQLTELERERKAREDAEARANAASESLRQTSIRTAIIQAAAEAGVKNVRLLQLAVDSTGLTVNDDGSVSGVDEAVQAALADNPELVGGKGTTTKPAQGATGDGPTQITQAELDAMSPEQVSEALKAGKLKHLL